MGRYRYRKKPKGKYKSQLEIKFAQMMEEKGLPFQYEAESFSYVRTAKYWPDWKIRDKVFIETKGYLKTADRSKLVSFKEQWPNITLFLVFGNAQNRIRYGSKTTYAMWAEKHGFEWADIRKGIPKEWWKE